MKVPSMNKIPSEKTIKLSYDPKAKTEKIDPRPEFRINAEEFPDIKNWSTGSKYKLMIEVEQVGSEIGEWGDDKGKMIARFKINGIASAEDGKEEKKEAKEEKTKFPKAMYGEKKK